MIKQSSLEELVNGIDIVDMISNYMELKKIGMSFKGLCPFHKEKTPSFTVNPINKLYYCFGCGRGGNVIEFVRNRENLNFVEAAEKLADGINLTLKYDRAVKKKDEKKILEQLNHFFQRKLNNKFEAKQYLNNRGVYESSIEKFGIGYAPSNQETMNFFRNNNFSLIELEEIGVIAFNDRGNPYSRFIERITFPIYSLTNKIVGFGGRTISNHPAKYLNSPTSKIFNKSKLLYGYQIAREGIFRSEKVIVTEGYMDVVMLQQGGFNNSVATLGTALTDEHIPIIKKGNPQIILAYDGDSAGISAALKASKILSRTKSKGGVVIFNDGLDPADMVQNHDIKKLQELFNKPKPFIEFALEQIIANYDIKDPLEREGAFTEAKSFLNSLPHILQDFYKSYLANILNIDERIIRLQPRAAVPEGNRRYEDIAELQIIKTLLSKPNMLDTLLDITNIKVFIHQHEFELLLNEQFDSKELIEISIRDDILELDEEKLIGQLAQILIRHYNGEMKKIKNSTSSIKEKRFTIRKIRENQSTLRRFI